MRVTPQEAGANTTDYLQIIVLHRTPIITAVSPLWNLPFFGGGDRRSHKPNAKDAYG